MKTVQLLLYPYISNLAIAFCFVPLLLLIWKKISREKAYLFVAIYWLANGLMNLPNWLGQAQNDKLQGQLTLLYNLLDAPLVLLVFFFSAAGMSVAGTGNSAAFKTAARERASQKRFIPIVLPP